MRTYWRRKSETRITKKHFLGDLTKREVEAIKDMLNISNWFMDVEILEKKPE